MQTVTLYKLTNYSGVPSWKPKHCFSFTDEVSFGFVGEVEERLYLIPEGFRVAESLAGEMNFYDKKNRHCTLDIHKGSPVLWTPDFRRVVLNRADTVVKSQKINTQIFRG